MEKLYTNNQTITTQHQGPPHWLRSVCLLLPSFFFLDYPLSLSLSRIPSIACGECCVVGLDDDGRPFPFLATSRSSHTWTLPSLFVLPSGHCSLLTTSSLHSNNPVACYPPATTQTCFLNFHRHHHLLHQRGTNFKLLSRPQSLLVNLRKVTNQERLQNLWIAITRIVRPVQCQLPPGRIRAKTIKRRSRLFVR